MSVCLAVINLQTTNKKAISQYLLKSIAGHQKVNRMKELNAVEVQDINGGTDTYSEAGQREIWRWIYPEDYINH